MLLDKVYQFLPDKESCVRYLERIRWPSSMPVCVYCKSYNVHARNHKFRYYCSDCARIFTIAVNTVFFGTRLPLQKWITAIYLVLNSPKGMVTSLWLANEIGVNRHSARYIIVRLRQAISRDDTFIKAVYQETDRVLNRQKKNLI